MKPCLVGLLLVMAIPARAASVDGYLASRDHAVAALKKDDTARDIDKRQTRALADLEKQLGQVIPPLQAEGFSRKAKINLESLIQEVGYGQLDGLVYTASKQDTRVLVTSGALLAAWLKAHENWWPNTANVPPDPKTALRSEAFYTQAISPDAAIAAFAEIPVKPKDAGVAVALLVQRRQDIGPGVPDEIVGGMVRGDRVFVVSQKVGATLEPVPACEAVRQTEQKKADDILATYNAGSSKDETLFERYVKRGEDSDADARRCFGEHIKDQPSYAEIARQAAALFDRLR